MHTIMIVDDEQIIRDSIHRFLTIKGYQSITAESAEEALSYIQSLPVDVVISDINMPHMDGTELLIRIKQLNPNIEVIMLTGLPTVETASLSMKHNAYDYLQKPIQFEELLNTVKGALLAVKNHEQVAQEIAQLHSDRTELQDNLEQQQQTMEQIQREFNSFAENSGDIFIRLDDAGLVVYVNAAFSKSLGYQFTGNRDHADFFEEFVLKTDLPMLLAALGKVINRQSQFETLDLQIRDSRKIHKFFSISISAVINGDQQVGVSCILQDRTDHYLAQYNLKQVNRNLRILRKFDDLFTRFLNSRELDQRIAQSLLSEFQCTGVIILKPVNNLFEVLEHTGPWKQEQLSDLIGPGSWLYDYTVAGNNVVFHMLDNHTEELGLQPDTTLAVVRCIAHQNVRRVLLLFSEDSELSSFSNAQLLKLLGTGISQAVSNNQLFADINRSKSDWEATFDSMPELIVIINQDGVIERANTRFIGQTQMDALSLIGSSIFDQLFVTADHPAAIKLRQALDKREPVQFDFIGHESRRDFNAHGIPNKYSQDYRYILIFEDVTEERYLETRNRELQNKLFQEAKLSSIGLLASGIAHNLNGPLTTILGYSDLLLMKSPDNKQISKVRQQALVMKGIISNLLQKSREEQNDEVKDLDFNHLLKQELDVLNANMLFKHEVQKEFEFDDRFPRIRGVYSDFSQSLSAMVNNSLEAMENEEEMRLQVVSVVDDGVAKLIISDNGSGMDGITQEKIFDPFFTTKKQHKVDDNPYKGGTGLGLTTVYNILSGYGIEIELESEPGKGTTFTWVFPESVCIWSNQQMTEQNDQPTSDTDR